MCKKRDGRPDHEHVLGRERAIVRVGGMRAATEHDRGWVWHLLRDVRVCRSLGRDNPRMAPRPATFDIVTFGVYQVHKPAGSASLRRLHAGTDSWSTSLAVDEVCAAKVNPKLTP